MDFKNLSMTVDFKNISSPTIDLVDHYVGDFLVACHFRSIDDGAGWAFAGVYGPNSDSSRSYYGRKWLAFIVGRIFLGVLEGISILLIFLVSE